VKIRDSDFNTFTRQQSIRPPANGTDQIYAIARALLHTWLAENPSARLRLLGVGGSKLAPVTQADLFAAGPEQSHAAIDDAVDRIRERFGSQALGRARILDRH
jgi:DNA polymerase IV